VDGIAFDSGQNETMGKVVSLPARLSPLRLRYLRSPNELTRYPGEAPLAEIHFAPSSVTASGPQPAACVSMEQLGGDPRVEIWTSRLPVRYGEAHGIRFSTNGELLVGVVSEPSIVAGADFERRVHAIYRDAFSLIESQGYPQLLRMWNYFPGINAEYCGLENYRRFCRARSLAFQEHYCDAGGDSGSDLVYRLPSASAVGTQGNAFVMSFVAGRTPGIHRENPRQVSAYSYPPQYGPRSPSFARATLTRVQDGEEIFFISGTASIVGHESLHVDDARAQIEETLRNIEVLIDSTHREEKTRFQHLSDVTHLKVYLRRAGDLDIAREAIERRIGTRADAVYLVGDICRGDLLLEIEAMIEGR